MEERVLPWAYSRISISGVTIAGLTPVAPAPFFALSLSSRTGDVGMLLGALAVADGVVE
jgi:hypothetical protein